MNEKVQLNAAKLNGSNGDILPYTGKRTDLYYSVDDAVNSAGYGKFQIRLLFLAGLGWLADSAEIFILSMIGDFVACDWELHRWQIALLSSVVFGSVMIGSPIFGMVADVYGRKMSLSVSMVMLFFFGALSAASPSFIWMVVFRICMGIALGGVGQGLTLCTEYCPPENRGKTGFYLCYFWSVGSMMVILLSWVIMKYCDNWRILLASASIPALIVVLSLKCYPESARYYLVSNQYDNARRILQKMADINGKDLPEGQLVEIAESYRRGRIWSLLNKEYRRTTLLFWYIWLAAAFAYYGIVLISPMIIQKGNLLVSNDNSTKSLLNDLDSIVPCLKFSQQFYIDLLWTTAAEFPGVVIFTLLVERISRKILLGASCFISSILILLLLINTKKIVILIFLFAARGIVCAVFQLVYIMTAEAFPTTIRALAIGTGSAFCRMGGIVVPFVAQVLAVEHPIAAMCILAGVLLLAAIAAALLPYETRGTQMKDVQ